MDSNALQAKSTELQTTATEIAVEFRQLLSFVESRNSNPQFDFSSIQANFDTVTNTLNSRIDALQISAQPCEPALRERCAQLSRLLRAIADDVRNELSHAPAQPAQGQYAARVPRNTAEAVTLIKSVISAAQSISSRPSSPPSSASSSVTRSPSPSLSVSMHPPARAASPAPPSPARALPPIPFSPTTPSPNPASPSLNPIPSSSSSSSQHAAPTIPSLNPASPSLNPIPSSSSPSLHAAPTTKPVRPLSITRSVSAQHMSPPSLHYPNPIPVPSPTIVAHTPVKRDTPLSPRNPVPSSVSSPAPSPSPSPSASPSLSSTTTLVSPGMHRSASLPHHSPPSGSSFPFRRTSVGPKKTHSMSIVHLADGTISVPSSSSFMSLLLDKSKDPALAKLVQSVSDSIANLNDIPMKAKMLAFFVGSTLGKIPAGDFDVCRNCAQTFSQLREKYPTDPCPIGEFSYGYARHRALLYKYLADAIALPARLRTYTSILQTPASNLQPNNVSSSQTLGISVVEIFVEKWFVVDLLQEIGELYDEDSPKAVEYKQKPVVCEDEQPIKEESPPTTESPEPNGTSESGKPSVTATTTTTEPSGKLGNNSTSSESPIKKSPVNGEIRKIGTPIRARSGTTSNIPSRTQRHSSYNSNSNTLPAGKQGKGGRVLRLPTDNNAEITLNERIGKGTFGDVYRCRISGFTCAVKIVNIKSMSESALKMMYNEIFFLETLIHENIIGFLGHEEIPRREIKIFMEFMPLSLASIIQKRNSTAFHFHKKDIIKCAKGMAEALAYLHHRKIIHRDIKSSNVLLEIDTTLDRIQEVRLCDFGVSKATSEDANAITFTGTNLWVAPEVFDVQFGIAANYDEKCDIWSFGMVLVEMVTLNPPYFGISTQQATQNIRNGISPSLEVNPDIDQGVANLIFMCLKKVPSERPSANEVLNFINQL